MSNISLARDVDLAPLTTLALGGRAKVVARCRNHDALRRALEIASDDDLEVLLLGGGSNVVVSDAGFDGLVIQYTDDRLSADVQTGRVHVAAGYAWDAFVGWTVGHGFAGLECLSGIPGWVGAAPIQNIGAYGREIASTVEAVHAIDLFDGREHSFEAHECAFDYRDSRFKREWQRRFCVTGIVLRLEHGGTPTIAYEELAETLRKKGGQLDPALVRETVLGIRRSKSMVLDANDPDSRSAGSFFTNPVVDEATAHGIEQQVRQDDAEARMPVWPVSPGRVKLAAAWLIERAGFKKGDDHGGAGLSRAHVLAIVNRREATAADVIGLAREIKSRVEDRFGVRLRPEPVPIGFAPGEVADLWG